MNTDYILLDTGNGKRLEQFGNITVIRPAKQADWKPSLPVSDWNQAELFYENEKWTGAPEEFTTHFNDITFSLAKMDNGQVGVFPEQVENWEWLQKTTEGEKHKILNGFAYTGGSTLFSSNHINKVTHLDASKPAIKKAKHNMELSFKINNNIRFIHDDVITFMKKEVKRGKKYDGFVFDPPAFGKGGKNKTWKLSKDLPVLMELIYELSATEPSFVLLTAHDPSMNAKDLAKQLKKMCPKSAKLESGDLVMKAQSGNDIKNGYFARFSI